MAKNKKFIIRDAKGQVFNTVKRPAIVADIEAGVMFKIGEYEDMATYFDAAVNAYLDGGFVDMAQSLVLIDGIESQEEIDKIFQITGYVKRYYEKIIAQKSNN